MRPKWVRGVTDKAALLEAEHTTFMEWRRRLSLIEETYDVTMTPYEKNPFFWRQLWRVVERSLFLAHVRARVRVCARVHSLSFSLSLFFLSLSLSYALSRARALSPPLSLPLSLPLARSLSLPPFSLACTLLLTNTHTFALFKNDVYTTNTHTVNTKGVCVFVRRRVHTHTFWNRVLVAVPSKSCVTHDTGVRWQ